MCLAFVGLTDAAGAEICLVEITLRNPSNGFSMTVLCEANVSACHARVPRGLCMNTAYDPDVLERHCTVVKPAPPDAICADHPKFPSAALPARSCLILPIAS